MIPKTWSIENKLRYHRFLSTNDPTFEINLHGVLISGSTVTEVLFTFPLLFRLCSLFRVLLIQLANFSLYSALKILHIYLKKYIYISKSHGYYYFHFCSKVLQLNSIFFISSIIYFLIQTNRKRSFFFIEEVSNERVFVQLKSTLDICSDASESRADIRRFFFK